MADLNDTPDLPPAEDKGRLLERWAGALEKNPGALKTPKEKLYHQCIVRLLRGMARQETDIARRKE